MNLETKLAQLGNRKDERTGAVSLPVYRATTYAHPGLGESTGFDYTRTKNPTRDALEQAIADLEQGTRGFAFASGMAAVHAVFTLFKPGDHLIVSNDLYGGTYRILEQILRPLGIETTFVATSEEDAVKAAVRPSTKAIFIETPTNPTMQITDLEACIRHAKEHGLLTIVDNTFLTPFFQRPLTLGADIVLHSATKYLGGHNDVLAGLVVAREEAIAEKLYFIQNSTGAVLGPDDCWLLLRGMKTLALRMERHQENALICAEWLSRHPLVKTVYYPGLREHPLRAVHERQATGYGGMVSFEVASPDLVAPLLKSFRLITFAESLGGVETLITYPARQTHFDIPEPIRRAVGVTDSLLRLSVGIEHSNDLLDDLHLALSEALKLQPLTLA